METYICAAMQTFFNSEELSFMQNAEGFNTKRKAQIKTITLLESLGESLINNHNLACVHVGAVYKISRGENFDGFPYFVLDVPRLQTESEIFATRIIVWWGNYVSVNLLLGENIFSRYRSKIMGKIDLIQIPDIYVSVAANFWKHDLLNTSHFIPGVALDLNMFQQLKTFKVSLKLPLYELNNFDSVYEAASRFNNLLL